MSCLSYVLSFYIISVFNINIRIYIHLDDVYNAYSFVSPQCSMPTDDACVCVACEKNCKSAS